MSAEKQRVWVFAIFLVALLVFAFAYHPVKALSRPVDHAASQLKR